MFWLHHFYLAVIVLADKFIDKAVIDKADAHCIRV